MKLCRKHAQEITQERKSLGLLTAKLRLELIGIDLDSPGLDGYVCAICEEGASYCTKRDTDGRFLLSIKAKKGRAAPSL
jgi:hypothetical protein